MFGKNNDLNNLKDTNSNSLGIVLKDTQNPISYTKINKLITALYMITDIMDKDEPLRFKLRTLGANILSDIYSTPTDAISKISEVVAFLDIAGIVNIVSDMNANILRSEFFELKKSIEDSVDRSQKTTYSGVDLNDLFNNNFTLPSASFINTEKESSPQNNSTRIGVQKGSTLLKALKDMSNTRPDDRLVGQGNSVSNKKIPHSNQQFEVLKKQRRDAIISIIKGNLEGATITDIKMKATGILASCGEKTLQRELMGMLKNGVLKKTGEKRWSKYFMVVS